MTPSVALHAQLERQQDETIQLCQALIRANTVNRYSGDPLHLVGNEANGQAVLEPLFAGLGATLEKFDCPPDIYSRMGVLGPRSRDFRDRPNLLARLDFGGGGPDALIQVHMDTVGVSGMTIEPWSGEVREGRIYGRGSSDCKGGIAAAAMAVRAVWEFRSQLHGSITFLSVVEEECNGSGAGALAACERGIRADFALCADGSGPEIGRGYSGVTTVHVDVVGVPGHASRPDGVSAIEKALVVKEGIDQLKREREAASDRATVNLGIFRGGVHPAVIPGSAELELNMCYPISDALASEAAGSGFNGSILMRRFEELVRAREQQDPWLQAHPVEITWVKDLLPFEFAEDHWLVQELADTHAAVLGRPAEPYVHPAWSDACYLPRFRRIPVVLYGAGTDSQPHGAGEYGEVERILDCSRVLAHFLYRKLAA
ncbi:MAG: M20/M25/M40 family metallo-hydrolase [Armatimonadetes bacterium]|nr:M20/M25/M40 family metallo-hydrolase [Armatimonadota bacterium]